MPVRLFLIDFQKWDLIQAMLSLELLLLISMFIVL